MWYSQLRPGNTIVIMVGNPYRYRAALQQLENRNATAGCLLALLLILPLAAKSWGLLPLFVVSLFYVTLVVPLAAGYTTISTMRRQLAALWNLIAPFSMLQAAVLWLHRLVLSLRKLQNTINQILFFVVMEKVMCPSQRYASLYLLLFYTVLCYLQHSLKTHHWTKLINESNAADLVRLTTAFILARLAKGVAMSFVLVTFTLHVSDLQPSCAYIAVTGFYFICTEFPESLSPEHWSACLLRKLDLYVLEGLEEMWLPVLIHSSAVFLSVVALIFSGPGNWTLRLLLGYHNLCIAAKRLSAECVTPLSEQRRLIRPFAVAGRRQLHDASVCAVCLDDMRVPTARVTPCGHVFHGRCLRQCLLLSTLCPLCKQQL